MLVMHPSFKNKKYVLRMKTWYDYWLCIEIEPNMYLSRMYIIRFAFIFVKISPNQNNNLYT